MAIVDAAGALSPLLALIALALEAAFGNVQLLSFLPGPLSLARRASGVLASRLDRPNRGERTLTARGGLLIAVIGTAAAGAGAVLDAILAADPTLRLAEAVVLASCLRLRAPWDEASTASRCLERRDSAGAAMALGISGRVGDEHAIARLGVERLCGDLVRGAVAPLSWYLLLGLPGALLSTAVAATAAGLARQRSSPSFARIPAAVDAALSLPAALLSAFLIALAALFVPRGHPAAAMAILARELGAHPRQGWRWPVAAAAGALDLSLGGRSSYAGWIGDGTARATGRDLRRMMLLIAAAGLLVAAALIGLSILLLTA